MFVTITKRGETTMVHPANVAHWLDTGWSLVGPKPVTDLGDMSAKALRDYAALHNVDLSGLTKKAQFVERITQAQEAATTTA